MSIITDQYLDRLISDIKQEQKLYLNKQPFEVSENDNKYIILLSQLITQCTKIKTFREPKEEKKPPVKKKY
jgi:hypothetical protein